MPLAGSAAVEDEDVYVLGIAVESEVVMLFPRGTSYYKVKRIADRYPDCEIVNQLVRVHYEVLPDNKPYDTSALVQLY